MFRRRKRRRERYQPEHDELEHGRGIHSAGIRQTVILLTVAFMVTLGVVIGTRLSSDAIAVLVGVIAGVAASIPCALLLMAVTRRRDTDLYPDEGDEYTDRDRYDDPRRAVPPVIVITPGQASPQQLAPWASNQAGWPPAWEEGAPPHSRRQFRVMGYDEQEDEQ